MAAKSTRWLVSTMMDSQSVTRKVYFNHNNHCGSLSFNMNNMFLITDSQFLSPYAMSAFVALRTKGMSFDVKTIHLGSDEQRSDRFLSQSLTSRVPTLIHDSYSLSESSAIAEYLEEIQPLPALYPQNVQQRNRARQIQAWMRSGLFALRVDRPTDVIFSRPTSQPLSHDGLQAAEKLFKVATSLLGHGGLNLFDTWSIADCDLSLMINRLIANGDVVPDRLRRYVQHQWQLPAIQEWVNLVNRPISSM